MGSGTFLTHKDDCAHVLMTNHVQLLVTLYAPGASSRMMQAIGRRYVGSFNARYQRTGTLWEARFKSALVDSDHYVLACYRYIELNPVRARMIDDPVAYRWSSCAANLGQPPHPSLSPHPAWFALGSIAANRTATYRCLLDEAISGDMLADIRAYLQ